ncbi:MAG: bacteriohemerythrin [Deltaproteobacteria bacterium]|nr:bacteriohemerythrin [Deltaproteobacteria bacterium]
MLGKVLSELVEYTVYHFSAEEKLLEDHAYPGLAWHRRLHSELTEKTKNLRDRFNSGEYVISIEVMNFLKDWLTNHIGNVDKKYGEFLNAKGVY